MTEKAKPTVFIDNERVRVTEWRFAPGAATGWHRHALDYLVVPMTDGELELVGSDGRAHALPADERGALLPQRRSRARRDQSERVRVRLRGDRAEVADRVGAMLQERVRCSSGRAS